MDDAQCNVYPVPRCAAKLHKSHGGILHLQAGSTNLTRLDSSARPELYHKYGLEAPEPRGQEADAKEEEDVGPEVNGVDEQGGPAASRRHLSAAERRALRKVGHAQTHALMFTS